MLHMNNKLKKSLSKERLKKTQDKIVKDMGKQVDDEGLWKNPIDSFAVDADSEVWKVVNGHAVLSAICYLNSKAKEEFGNQKGHGLNRDFEFALSEAYDYICFKNTTLYKNLHTAGLLRA